MRGKKYLVSLLLAVIVAWTALPTQKAAAQTRESGQSASREGKRAPQGRQCATQQDCHAYDLRKLG